MSQSCLWGRAQRVMVALFDGTQVALAKFQRLRRLYKLEGSCPNLSNHLTSPHLQIIIATEKRLPSTCLATKSQTFWEKPSSASHWPPNFSWSTNPQSSIWALEGSSMPGFHKDMLRCFTANGAGNLHKRNFDIDSSHQACAQHREGVLQWLRRPQGQTSANSKVHFWLCNGSYWSEGWIKLTTAKAYPPLYSW